MEKRLFDLLQKTMLKIGLIKDFIVEEGEDGDWKYRKWYSGIGECWMCWQGMVARYNSSAGMGSVQSLYRNTWELPFPFVERYVKQATTNVASGISYPTSGYLGDTLETVTLHWAGNASSGLSTINMYIIGYYKTPIFR